MYRCAGMRSNQWRLNLTGGNAEAYLCICILIVSTLLGCSAIDVGNAELVVQKWVERLTLFYDTLV